MIKATTVSIVHDDSRQAGIEAAEELLDELGGEPELVLLFAGARFNQAEILAGIYSRLSAGVRLVGCSSYGEINSEEALVNSVTAMGLRFDGVTFQTFKIAGGGDSFGRGKAFAAEVKAFEPNLLIVFPDGLGMNSTQFLLGLQEVLGRSFPIVGGVAADQGDFSRTFEYFDREVLSGGAVGVALKGPIEIVTAAKSGWLPIGATHTCTRVEDGNVLLELDGHPALSLYREYLGERYKEMPLVGVEYPIGMVGGVPSTQKLPDEQILLLRAIKGVDEARQAIVFGGDVPEGAEVRMTRATKQDVIRGADEAGTKVLAALSEPSVALIFDCMARKIVLGPRYKDELKATFARIGDRVPKIGFYTFGELSPVQGVTMHHDETFTVALLKA